jgi:hypothetical protein
VVGFLIGWGVSRGVVFRSDGRRGARWVLVVAWAFSFWIFLKITAAEAATVDDAWAGGGRVGGSLGIITPTDPRLSCVANGRSVVAGDRRPLVGLRSCSMWYRVNRGTYGAQTRDNELGR